MEQNKAEISERRTYHRVTYPPEKSLELKIGSYTFKVVDISRKGIRFLNPERIKIAEWIGATITLQDGSALAVEGKIIWTDDHLLGVQLLNPIPYNTILDEQCYLIQEGMPRSQTSPETGTKPETKDRKIYIVQHGEPVPKEIDPDRPLSDKGRRDVTKMGMFLKETGLSPGIIVHSGKTRAAQTAELLGSLLNPEKGVVRKDGLAPNDPVEAFLVDTISAQEDIMVVGHLPFLSRFARMLLGTNGDQDAIAFQQGGIVCLARGNDNTWRLAWMVVPELLP